MKIVMCRKKELPDYKLAYVVSLTATCILKFGSDLLISKYAWCLHDLLVIAHSDTIKLPPLKTTRNLSNKKYVQAFLEIRQEECRTSYTRRCNVKWDRRKCRNKLVKKINVTSNKSHIIILNCFSCSQCWQCSVYDSASAWTLPPSLMQGCQS